MTEKLAYLGPPGTFSEEAALVFNRSGNRVLQQYNTIADVIEAVVEGEVEEGIVPLENSLEGGVSVTQDLLVDQDGIYIINELIYPINHCLMALPELRRSEIKLVYSHPQALGQCRRYLRRFMPGVTCYPAASTGAAARIASESMGVAAIAPRRAAELFNLNLLEEGIQDFSGNMTRFITVSRCEKAPTGCDKTSLVFAIPDGPGSLYQVLGLFAQRQINLTRIESRPARRQLGDYLFFIDFEGHHRDPQLQTLWVDLQSSVVSLKLLGSYPRATADQYC